MRTLLVCSLLAIPVLAAGAVAAQEITRLDPGTTPLTDLPTLPGVANAPLLGEMAATGLFASEAQMREGSVFPPHSHPDTRLTIVISGTMHLGEGDVFDDAGLVTYPAGSAAVTPAGTMHFMAAPDGDVRVLEIGVGPSASDFAVAP